MPGLKGVIIAAGYGSRFLPVTKTIPKEMLPLVDVPCIDFIVREMIEAGIKDILIVTHRKKKALEDYFDRDIELENFFERENKKEFLEKIKPYPGIRFAFVRQKEMKGTGDAVLTVESFIGDSPFIVAYPDDIIFSDCGLSKQMAEVFFKHKKSILATLELSGDVSKYGVVQHGAALDSRTFELTGLVEKPKKGTEPSKNISVGRYLFTPEIFECLKSRFKADQPGEFFITDGIEELIKKGKALSYSLIGKRLDTGTPGGYLEAVLEYAYTKPELKSIITDFIKTKG